MAIQRSRRKRRKRRRVRWGNLILIFLLPLAFLLCYPVLRDLTTEATPAQQPDIAHSTAQTPIGTTPVRETDEWITDSFASPYALLWDIDNGKVLYEKNADRQAAPASLTKIMTALVALEKLDDLTEVVPLPAEIFPTLQQQDAALAGFLPDEKVTVEDLLYGLLLPSGAECAEGLALAAYKSEEKFVAAMNQKASDMGLTGTHFTNPVGLHDEAHYTTARDMATIMAVALQNPIFVEMITTSRHSTQSTNLHPDGITFYSTLSQQMEAANLQPGPILGGKTGYTKEAGCCLASLAQQGEHRYLLITLGAPDGTSHIEDALGIYQKYLPNV